VAASVVLGRAASEPQSRRICSLSEASTARHVRTVLADVRSSSVDVRPEAVATTGRIADELPPNGTGGAGRTRVGDNSSDATGALGPE